MNRLLIAAMLAILLHSLLFLIGDYQMPERTVREAPDSQRISVTLESYTPKQSRDEDQVVVTAGELEMPESPEPGKETPEKPAEPGEVRDSRDEIDIKENLDDKPKDTESEKPEPETIMTEGKPGPEKAPVLDEHLTARQATASRDLPDIKEKDPEFRAEKSDKGKRKFDAGPITDSAVAAREKDKITYVANETGEALDEFQTPDTGFQDRKTDQVEQARPLYRDNPPPRYPPQARRRHYEGIVVLDVLVDAWGRAEEVKVAKSSGHSILDRAAREAVQDWRFEPGRRGGRPMDMWVRLPVRFELQ